MMSGQIAPTTDRSRLHWTPSMERYFIDLMLEHLQRGNRVGHTFNRHAWNDMITLFNAKFGSQCDKDVLKSRYASLWKQFHDVKNILCHVGFSWDAARQMVVADDVVWDTYVKDYPEARCYRTKSVPNFDDLCVIYSYTSVDGRYSLSSHDVCADDEVQGGDGIGSNAVSTNKTDWTDSMDQFFVELLLDQLGRGNKINNNNNNSFNKQAWTDMLDMFNAKFGSQYCKRILKNRYKKLLKYYCDITNLLKQGFLWNDQQQMLSADDDVWDAYIKAHPHARTYRLKILPNYCDLEIIFKNASDADISNLHQEKSHEDVMSEIKAGEGRGSHNPSGTDRSRTYWTPPMDRYLIDLLLEQVKSGNRLGQTFLTQAWNDMTISFNEQFKSQCDKDVLKNRYKHLRKQFNEVANLLRESGFSWDDTREMVAADDHVWDAYIKVTYFALIKYLSCSVVNTHNFVQVHPAARSLRVKTLPGYRKLCVILGEDCSDTRYIRLSRSADPGSELPLLITGEQNNSTSPSDYVAASTLDWTESMECCFVDLVIEQVNRGNGIGNSLNEQAWTHLIEAFNAKFGFQCDKQLLVDHYFCLMKQHDDISNLLSHSGFAWDETLQMIIAENDIWDAYIKDHPDAISYKNRFLHLYLDLCKVFGNKASNVRASAVGQLQLMEANDITIEMDMDGSLGNLVVSDNTEVSFHNRNGSNEIDMIGTSGNLDLTSNNETSNQDTERPREMDMDSTFGDVVVASKTKKINGACKNLVMNSNTKISNQFKKRPSTVSLDSRHPKKDPRMKEALCEMASAVKALMKNKEKNNNSSLGNALSALQAMPDIDDELVIDACDLLEDERMAKIFLALKGSLRKKWLLRKLRR